MSQQQPIYPYDPTMEYGPVIESPPDSTQSKGTYIVAIVVVAVIIVLAVMCCLWRRRRDRDSEEAEPQVDQEAPPPEPTGNANGKKPESGHKEPAEASRERSVFEFGSTSHGGGGPAPPHFGGGYGPPPHFGGGYGPAPPYFYGGWRPGVRIGEW